MIKVNDIVLGRIKCKVLKLVWASNLTYIACWIYDWAKILLPRSTYMPGYLGRYLCRDQLWTRLDSPLAIFSNLIICFAEVKQTTHSNKNIKISTSNLGIVAAYLKHCFYFSKYFFIVKVNLCLNSILRNSIKIRPISL